MTSRRLMLVALALALALEGGRVVAQTTTHDFWFDTGRPLAKAADALEQTYGWVVNYEDVPVFGLDTRDATTQVNHGMPLYPGQVPTIVPNGLAFAFSVEDSRATDAAGILDELVRAYQLSNNPGTFHVVHVTGTVFDLIPDGVRDARGTPSPYTPILDTRISMPAGPRTAFDVLFNIRDALTQASGTRVAIGAGFSSNGLHQRLVEGGAQNEIAREVLRRFLKEFDPVDRISWRFLCDPGDHFCVINIH